MTFYDGISQEAIFILILHFLLNSNEYDTEQAKLENDLKKIFYKNNCPKLNSIIL